MALTASLGAVGAAAGVPAPASAVVRSGSASPAPVASSSAGGSGSSNATFGLGPARGGKLDGRINYGYVLPPGGVVHDQVAVVNVGASPLTLNIYAADALNTPTGSLALQPGFVKPADSAQWVRIATPGNKGYVVVPARTAKGPSVVYLPFTLVVPKGAVVGDHLAGLVASLVSKGQTAGDRAAEVKLEQRVGVRLSVRVAGELRPSLVVEGVSASYRGSLDPVGTGTVTVTYTVRNTGNVRLGGRPSIDVHALVGPSATAAGLADIPLLLPGFSATVTSTVTGVRPWGYETAEVTVVPLAAVGDADPVPAPVSGSTRFWAMPWTLLALLVLLAIIAGLLLRRRSRPAPPPSVASSGPALAGVGASHTSRELT